MIKEMRIVRRALAVFGAAAAITVFAAGASAQGTVDKFVVSGPAAKAEQSKTVISEETAKALVQACEATQSHAQCCFVTANAAAHLLPARPFSDKARRSALADAPLAGLARTLMNEGFGGTVRWVDLETSEAAIEVTAKALAHELHGEDGEQEVILTAAGERYAQRLRPTGAPRAAQPQALPAEPRNARLGFTLPGQLRNLQWETYPRVAMVGDQVEVAVRATGLNFRDTGGSAPVLRHSTILRARASTQTHFCFDADQRGCGR